MFNFNLSVYINIGSNRYPTFVVCFLLFTIIVSANLVIILVISCERALHEPMYIFIAFLSINSLYGCTGFYPKFLIDLLSTFHVISYAGCLLQGFVLHSSACADFSILVLMAYDRYVAICRPLRYVAICRPLVYHSVMTTQRVCVFIFFAWLIPLYLVFMSSITTARSRLCGSHIPKIYCINFLVGKLACTTSIANGLPAGCSAAAEPHSDAADQDALGGSTVKRVHGEVLSEAHTQELGPAHSLHSGTVDGQWRVLGGGSLEVDNNPLRLLHV
ncbi:LOW QUALITY PROTEIN: olfactory receptor 1D2-like [Larimichthys crocea]|uniref:LOW QUALITY PROTEIN: olfactory receptor 1D2-like n=1 Tax=Larimichthys crocea TaxID=215358 RepID=UPI000F5EAAE0|nr:LOW QUALITY PROTEIN: olfactory receptor 1D2-like [Larimichthys crocea]